MPGGGDKSGGGGGGPKPKFADHEKVLCYHGPLLYEAKCVKSRKDTKSGNPGDFQYFVHYQGWNKNWDEWVDETRILKASSENFDRKEKLFAQHQASVKENKKKGGGGASGSKSGNKDGKGPGGGGGAIGGGPDGLSFGGSSSSSSKKSDSANTSRASTPVSEPQQLVPSSSGGTAQGGSSSSGPGSASKQKRSADSAATEADSTPTRRSGSSASAASKKRARLDTSTSSENTAGNATFNIAIPEELKYVLVSDWDLVTSRKQLFRLPAKLPASTILADFMNHVGNNQKQLEFTPMTAEQVTLGIRDFFNVVIADKLLYKIERLQYSEQLGGDEAPAPIDVYGSAHLLRLFAKINGLLNRSRIETEGDVALVSSVLNEFLTYLESNRSKYFTSKNYVSAGEDYLAKLEQETE